MLCIARHPTRILAKPLEPGDDLEFRVSGLNRVHLANATPGWTIFREARALASLPYFNPHSLRNTLVQLAYELKLDAERFRAWSQNLGHAGRRTCLTTFSSYGEFLPLGTPKSSAASPFRRSVVTVELSQRFCEGSQMTWSARSAGRGSHPLFLCGNAAADEWRDPAKTSDLRPAPAPAAVGWAPEDRAESRASSVVSYRHLDGLSVVGIART